MTLDEQYEQRKVALDAIAIETRNMVDAVQDAGLQYGERDITLDGSEFEWHIRIRVNVRQHFVHVEAHTHRESVEQPDPSVGSFIEFLTGGQEQDPMNFQFNCPIDWVPRAEL